MEETLQTKLPKPEIDTTNNGQADSNIVDTPIERQADADNNGIVSQEERFSFERRQDDLSIPILNDTGYKSFDSIKKNVPDWNKRKWYHHEDPEGIEGDYFYSLVEDAIESKPEESIEMAEQLAEASPEISKKDVEPLVKEAEQLTDSNSNNDEVNNESIDDFFKNLDDDENIGEKIKKIGSFLPDIGNKKEEPVSETGTEDFDFMSFADSADEGKTKTENPYVPETDWRDNLRNLAEIVISDDARPEDTERLVKALEASGYFENRTEQHGEDQAERFTDDPDYLYRQAMHWAKFGSAKSGTERFAEKLEKLEKSVKDDIKKDIDNDEDLLWFEQLTQESKKEKKADRKRKKEENKNWMENQASEDLDAIKEDFEQYDVPATMSDNVPAEIYDNENIGGEVGPWNSEVGPARILSDYNNDENLKFAGESWLTDDEIDDIVEESSPDVDEETKERRKKILKKFRLAVAKANPNLSEVNSTETELKENPNIKSGVHPSELNVSKSGGAGASISGIRSSPPKEKGANYRSRAGGGDVETEVPETTNTGKFSGSTNSVHQSEHLSQTMENAGKSAGKIKTGSANLSGKEGHTALNKAEKVPSIDRNMNVTSVKEKIIGLSKGWPVENGYRYSGSKYLPFKFWVKDDAVEIGQIGTGRHRQSLEAFIKKEPIALQQLRGVLK